MFVMLASSEEINILFILLCLGYLCLLTNGLTLGRSTYIDLHMDESDKLIAFTVIMMLVTVRYIDWTH